MAPLGDDELREHAFRLSQVTPLRVYALVEHMHGSRSSYDGGWIVDLASGERVLDLNPLHGARAGGAGRNRRVEQKLTLPAGDYLLVAGTDDSHSYPDFRSPAPYDPEFWGITLIAETSAARANFASRPSSSTSPVVCACG